MTGGAVQEDGQGHFMTRGFLHENLDVAFCLRQSSHHPGDSTGFVHPVSLSQVTDIGGLALCRSAKAALLLHRLNLSLNPALTSATMLALADAVRFHSGTLAEVALAGCRASEDAAMALLKAANKNNTLQLLDIRGVPLGAEVRAFVHLGHPTCVPTDIA